MPLYRTPMVRGDWRGRRPAGADGLHSPQVNWLYFKPDDCALLWSEVTIRHPQAILMADSLDERLRYRTSRRLITDFVGDRDFSTHTRMGQALVHGLRYPPRRWPPLMPTKQGWFEIWFGPGARGQNLLYLEPAWLTHSSKDIQDNFNRTENLSGSTGSGPGDAFTWTEAQGTALTLNGTEATASNNAGFVVGMVSLDMDTADHYAEAVIGTFSGAGFRALGVAVRLQDGASGTEGYGFEISQNSAARRIYDWSDDASLDDDTTSTSSGTLRLEASGSSATAFVNGTPVLGPVTAGYTTRRRTGISMFIGDNAAAGLTSFRAADLVTTATWEQLHYRWRNDDGTETTAPWARAEDTAL